MNDNPYTSPRADKPQPSAWPRIRKLVGSAVGLIGACISAYAAIAFWLFQGLPPNNMSSGRLPSLLVLFGGMAILLTGLAIRNLRLK